ncbi:MAG TPA: outer membrane protein [Xanthobacteraceae bacterium]|jgi:outer membrane immunogenic protein
MMRKSWCIGVAAILLSNASAFAADAPVRGPIAKAPPATAAALFNWSGFYYGIQAGYAWGDSTHVDPATGLSSGNIDVNGWLLGGTIGANWQSGALVVGVEGDLAWANVDGSGGSAAACVGACFTELNWLGTGRVRAGLAADAYLFYVTGGVAFGGVEGGQAGFGSGDKTRVGWTVGAGVEAAVAQNWTAKIEYLYADLGDKTTYTSPSGTFNVDYKSHIVRVGLNYKF